MLFGGIGFVVMMFLMERVDLIASSSVKPSFYLRRTRRSAAIAFRNTMTTAQSCSLRTLCSS